MAHNRKRKRFDAFHRHEVLDRASVVLDIFARQVAEHPVVEATPTLKKLAESTLDALQEFYAAAANDARKISAAD